MPIFTLRLKSMPSTNSRNPCTKCWRDCSPSVTMSMPASSCSLSQSSVASRFARSSATPVPRHAGQSLFGSASHSGLGRLPAMVVFSMVFGGSCRDFGTATKSRYANIMRGYKRCFSSASYGEALRGVGRDRGYVRFLRVRHLQPVLDQQGRPRLAVERRTRRRHPQSLFQAERDFPPLRPRRASCHALPRPDRALLAARARLDRNNSTVAVFTAALSFVE